MKIGLRVVLLGLLILLTFACFAQNTIGTIEVTDKAQDGYTLFAPNSSRTTYLVDNCGNIVNEWVSQGNPGLSAYLTPEGNLVRTRRESNNTFFAGGVGGAIEIFDWDGTLIWEFVLSNGSSVLHHDIAVMPNGNILAIAYELIGQQEALSLGRDFDLISSVGLWADKIIEIKPLPNNAFEIVWEWRAIDHVVQDLDSNVSNFGVIADSPGKLNINYPSGSGSTAGQADWMHSNAIDYNEELDQVILNSRNYSEFYIIDHSTTTAEASTSEGGAYGKGGDFLYRWGNPLAYNAGTEEDRKLFSQHDAHWIEDGMKDGGKIFVFNNGLNRPEGLISTVDLIAPPIQSDGSYALDGIAFGPSEAEWVYGLGEDEEDITSSRISSVGRMENGNTLITVGSDGRIVEIDENLEVVWKYVIPVTGGTPNTQGNNPVVNTAFRSYKYPIDYPAFLKQEIVVGEPIELEPNIGFCLALPVDRVEEEPTSTIELLNTVVGNELRIKSAEDAEIAIFDINGIVHYTFNITAGQNEVNVNLLAPGMYFIKQVQANYPIFVKERFIKTN